MILRDMPTNGYPIGLAIIELALPARRDLAILYQSLISREGEHASPGARILLWNDLVNRVDAGDFSVFGKDNETSEVTAITSLARADPDIPNGTVTIDGRKYCEVTFFHRPSVPLGGDASKGETSRPGPKSSQDDMRMAAAELAKSGRRFLSAKEEHRAVLELLGKGDERGFSYQTFIKAKAAPNL